MNNSSTLFKSIHHSYKPDTQFLHKRISIIKRPPLIRSNSPTLKETKKKSVRFHDNKSLENIRLFLKTQTPKDCQKDPPCRQMKYTVNMRTHWTGLNTTNLAVRLEKVDLITDHLLRGTIQVSNLAFEKHVQVIYTMDDWSTTQQLDALYMEPMPHCANTWDRFVFELKFNPCHQTINLAVKYTVAGRDFWDNNHNKNYQIDIIPDVQLLELQEESTFSDESDELHLDQLSLNESSSLLPSENYHVLCSTQKIKTPIIKKKSVH